MKILKFVSSIALALFMSLGVVGSVQAAICPNNGAGECRSFAMSGATMCQTPTGFDVWCCPQGKVVSHDHQSCVDGSLVTPVEPLSNDTFDFFNPLKQNADAEVAEQLSTPAGIINRALIFAFPLAGIILFVMLTWAGFEIVAGGGSKKAQDAGKQRATAAVIGFVLLFVSYWIIQIVEVVFNVAIL